MQLNKIVSVCFILFLFLSAKIHSQEQFSDPNIIDRSRISHPFYINAADLDNDGDNDMISGSFKKIAWYENDGYGKFNEQKIISREYVEDVFPFDIDKNGTIDIVSISDINLVWYENNGQGSFADQKLIADSIYANSLCSADMNGDSIIDFIYNSGNTIGWIENSGSMNFQREKIITDSVFGIHSLQIADLDNDEDMDIIYGSFVDEPTGVMKYSQTNNKIAWYENKGNGEFDQHHVIYAGYSEAVHAFDINGDENTDLLYSFFDEKLAYFINDGKGGFGEENIITHAGGRKTSFCIEDLNRDNSPDIIYFATNFQENNIYYLRNNDSTDFSSPVLIADSVYHISSIATKDLDGDADFDIMATSYSADEITWYENIDGDSTFGNGNIITTRINPLFIRTGDLDSDGDQDFLWANRVDASWMDNKIVWYENLDGSGNFSDINFISKSGVSSIHMADIDEDSDLDILYTIRFISTRKLGWYENLGNGVFSNSKLLIKNVTEPMAIIDIDGDNYKDIVYSGYSINWCENQGNANFTEEQTIVPDALLLDTADVDNDGLFDIIFCSQNQDSISWVKNLGGGDFTGAKYFYDLNIHSFDNIDFIDLNEDDKVDILYNRYYNNTIQYYLNNGNNTFTDSIIIDSSFSLVQDLIISDFDNDWDQDIVANCAADECLVWYENSGNGNFIKHKNIMNTSVIDLSTADFNNDGYPDIAWGNTGNSTVGWSENLRLSEIGKRNKLVQESFELLQNYPNPFNAVTTIKYNLPKSEKVQISIYNINGCLLETVKEGTQNPGIHSIKWNAANLSSGIYFYEIQAGEYKKVKKALLVK